VDIRTIFQNLNGLICAGGLKDVKSGIFDHEDRVDAEEKLIFHDKDNGPSRDSMAHAKPSG
jgi:hypothetical protein